MENTTTNKTNDDFFGDVETILDKTNGKNELRLEKGMNVVRLLAKPQVAYECFCVTTKEITDKNGEKKMLEINEPVYDGCGYEADARTVFYTYAISEKDQLTEDGKPKIQLLSVGKKILEHLLAQNKARIIQGEVPFKSVMELDTIINKTGEGLNTTYTVNVMLKPENNKIKFTMAEIEEALAEMPDIKKVLADRITDAQERHAKYGKPEAKAKLERAKKIKEAIAELPVVEYDAVDVEEEINVDDIPF